MATKDKEMIKYVQGDLFADIDKLSENKKVIIPHIVNNLGIMGSGFVIGLKNKYPRAEEQYLKWYKNFSLGYTHFVGVDDNVIIANMFAQEGIGGMSKGGLTRSPKPIKYAALMDCMEEIASFIKQRDSKHHIVAPAFGSLRSAGNWGIIHELIEEIWANFNVTIYYLDEKQRISMESNLNIKIP